MFRIEKILFKLFKIVRHAPGAVDIGKNCEENIMTEIKNHSFDGALEEFEEDSLNRVAFAERVFEIIDSTPLDSNMRVGIFGKWGSGKTTVLNFIKKYCIKKNHPVAWFNPWQYKNKEDAWYGFVSIVDKALSNKKFSGFKRRKIIRFISEGAKKIAEIAESKIGKAIGNLILSPLTGLLDESKEIVENEIAKKLLSSQRLYIFIDDLDRTDPEIIYNILMMLNEIVDLKRCVYIVGLDNEAVKNILNQKFNGFNAREFLEKILNWTFELPLPDENNWKQLIKKELELNKRVDSSAFNSVFEILPQNPRTIKKIIRYLNSIHKGFLDDRYEKEEINLKFLYTLQILRMEFPAEFVKIIENDEIIKDLSYGDLGIFDKEEDSWLKLYNEVTNTTENKERFMELIVFLRDQRALLMKESFINHFLVLEMPALMTWKEYNNLFEPLDFLKKIDDFINRCLKNEQKKNLREFLKMISRHYIYSFEKIISAPTRVEVSNLFLILDKLLNISLHILDNDLLFNSIDPIFNYNVFKEWYYNYSKYVHFTSRFYSRIRKTEKQILLKLSNKASYLCEEFLNEQYSRTNRGLEEHEKAFKITKEKIKLIFEKQLASVALHRFEKDSGIKEIYSDNKFYALKKILLDSDSVFFKSNNIKKLFSILKNAKNNVIIQKNVFDYFELLILVIKGDIPWSDKDKIEKLFSNKRFITKIWNAVIATPLNTRFVGTINSYLEYLIQNNKILKDFLKKPKWWNAFIKRFTQTSISTPTNTPVITNTFTATPTRTSTSTHTYTSTFTPTGTMTSTRTLTPTLTITDTISSNTPTRTPSYSPTYTITLISTSTMTRTFTMTLTGTPSITASRTATVTNTFTATFTYTVTYTLTPTRTWTSTSTPTWTITVTATPTLTVTATNTPINTATRTITITLTATTTPIMQEITDVRPCPNPVNPIKDSEVRIVFKIAQQDIDTIIIRIYTSGYRLIKEVKYENGDAVYAATQGFVSINTKELKMFANSTYYFYIKTEKKGEICKSKIEKLVILK